MEHVNVCSLHNISVSVASMCCNLRNCLLGGIRGTITILPSVPIDKKLNVTYCLHWMIHHTQKLSYWPYCGCVNFLSPVGYLCLIWVVSGANHRTGGGWDAAGADGSGARFAD